MPVILEIVALDHFTQNTLGDWRAIAATTSAISPEVRRDRRFDTLYARANIQSATRGQGVGLIASFPMECTSCQAVVPPLELFDHNPIWRSLSPQHRDPRLEAAPAKQTIRQITVFTTEQTF